jgi:cystathionine beta-lyase
VIIPDPKLRDAFRAANLGLVPWPNLMGLIATEAAWNGGDPWP